MVTGKAHFETRFPQLPALAKNFDNECSYLIFVIFYTQAKILDRKFYTKERINYGKRILQQNSVNCDLLAQANYTNYTLCVKLHTECKSWVSFV